MMDHVIATPPARPGVSEGIQCGTRRGRVGATTVFAALSTVIVFAFSATPASAQTRFARPDKSPDYTRYLTSEDCIVAVRRVSRSEAQQSPIWRDTARMTQRPEREPLPNNALTVAKSCGQKFHPDSVSLEYYDEWMRVFLAADRDDAADVVARRRLATTEWITPDVRNDRGAVLLHIMMTYGSVAPLRWKAVQSYAKLLDEPGSTVTALARLSGYQTQFDAARVVDDTATQRSVAEGTVALAQRLTSEDKGSHLYKETGQYFVMNALTFLERRAILDSLRKSATAYVSVHQALWAKARSASSFQLPNFIGQRSSPVVADWWFGPNGAAVDTLQRRPVSGTVNLVVFLYQGCHDNAPIFLGRLDRPTFRTACWDSYAIMRRMTEAYPDLAITIVAMTNGYLGEQGPLAPAEEAVLLKEWWLNFHHLPVTLAVHNTQFFRLQDVDRRRIDRVNPNEKRYLFKENPTGDQKRAYIVDDDGTILYSEGLHRSTERTFREILDVLAQRKQ